MKTLVVIVCYRVAQLTIECLHSLAPTISGTTTRVIVCENGTGDDSADLIERAIHSEQWNDWCELLRSPVNLGFTGGNNIAIRKGLADFPELEYILLLNPDTIVNDKTISELVSFVDATPQAGLAGSRLLNPDKSIGPSPFRFEGILSELIRGFRFGPLTRLLQRYDVSPPPPAATSQAEWLSGACLMIRREVIDQIGLLDEDYFTYFEDMDYCWRARLAGWENWYVPSSTLIHYEGMSGDSPSADAERRRPRFWHEARRRYFLKNHGALTAALADAGFLAGSLFAKLRGLIQPSKAIRTPHLIRDSWSESVFRKGFRLPVVQAPKATSPKATLSNTSKSSPPVTT